MDIVWVPPGTATRSTPVRCLQRKSAYGISPDICKQDADFVIAPCSILIRWELGSTIAYLLLYCIRVSILAVILLRMKVVSNCTQNVNKNDAKFFIIYLQIDVKAS